VFKKSYIVPLFLLLSACHHSPDLEPGPCPTSDEVRLNFEEMMSTRKLRHVPNGKIYELFSVVGDTTINPTRTMSVTEVEPNYAPSPPELFKDVCYYKVEDSGRSLTVGVGVRRSCHH